ncbi:MAG: transcriptional regulator [Clostridia bacterium]|nr:transcriptional regulator [Clostridia bacterium]
MAETTNARTRLISLVEIMTMYSDHQNILSAEEICQKLNEYGYSATKRTVLSDIKAINTTPIKIIAVNKPKKGYYIVKCFSQSALNLIIEALLSSSILSENDIDCAIKHLRRNVCMPTLDLILSTNQSTNSSVPKKEFSFGCLYNLRIAIRDKKQVALVVTRIVPGDSFSPAEQQETIIVNPLKIATDNESVVLICTLANTPKKTEFIALTRIKNVSILNENVTDFSADTADAVNHFSSVPAESKLVSAEWLLLKIKEDDVELVENCFSSPVQFRNSKDKGFCVAKLLIDIDVNIIGKLFVLGDRIEILKPAKLKELFAEKAKYF